jgi:hypothetical protein
VTDFPTIVYRCPGPHWGPPKTTYESIGVADQSAFDKAIAEGYFATLPEAAEAYLNPPTIRLVAAVPLDETFPDEAPPTRDEMLTKAAEIGLVVDKRWSDKTLANKIIDALMAAEAAKTAEPAPAPEETP